MFKTRVAVIAAAVLMFSACGSSDEEVDTTNPGSDAPAVAGACIEGVVDCDDTAVIDDSAGPESPDTDTADARDDSRVRLVAFGFSDAELPQLQIEIQNQNESLGVNGTELVATADYQQRHSDWIETAGEEFTVRFTFVAADGAALSDGEVSVEVRLDWEWDVQFHLAAEDPAGRCFGCEGSHAYPLAGDSGAQIFIVWGGNSISDPVVY
jgi:hypothetical protein